MKARKYAILFAITATQFAIPFMLSAIAVALPTIGRDMGAVATELSLVELSYVASVAIFLLPFGRIADAYGRGFIFILGQILYTVGTLILGFAPGIYSFILIRVIQGLAGAMIVSTGLAVLTEAFPKEERGRAIGIAVTGVYAGISLGPPLGGFIVTEFGWRWIFFIGVMLGLLALYLSLRALSMRIRRQEGFIFDWAGTVLIACVFAPMVAGSAHFTDPLGKAGVAVSLFFLVLFIIRERKARDPLVDLKLFRTNTTYSFGCGVQFISYAGTFGVTFLMSLYLQSVHAMTAAQAGAVLIIQPLTQAVLSPFCGMLADKWRPNRVAASGMALCTAGLLALSLTDMNTPLPLIMVVLAAMGVGIALFASPNMSMIMGSVPPRLYGAASAMTGAMRTMGMTFGMVLIAVVLSLIMGERQVTPETGELYSGAMHIAVIVLACLSAAGMLLSLKTPVKEDDSGDGG